MAGGKSYSRSDIVDVAFEKAFYFQLSSGVLIRVMKGHCPGLDLGPNGVLFVVNSEPYLPRLKGDIASATSLLFLPFEAYPVRPRGYQYPLSLLEHKEVSGSLVGKVEMPVDRLPMIARFRDIDDPSTFEELDPNDLSSAYGPGSRVVRATLEITKDAPTPVPSYWPAWIAQAKSTMGLALSNAKTDTPKRYISMSQIKGSQN